MNIKALVKTVLSMVGVGIMVIAFSMLIYYYPITLLIIATLCVLIIVWVIGYIIYGWFDERSIK